MSSIGIPYDGVTRFGSHTSTARSVSATSVDPDFTRTRFGLAK